MRGSRKLQFLAEEDEEAQTFLLFVPTSLCYPYTYARL